MKYLWLLLISMSLTGCLIKEDEKWIALVITPSGITRFIDTEFDSYNQCKQVVKLSTHLFKQDWKVFCTHQLYGVDNEKPYGYTPPDTQG